MKKISTILQAGGAGLIVAGIAAFSLPIAVIIAGIFLVIFGIAVERSDAS